MVDGERWMADGVDWVIDDFMPISVYHHIAHVTFGLGSKIGHLLKIDNMALTHCNDRLVVESGGPTLRLNVPYLIDK